VNNKPVSDVNSFKHAKAPKRLDFVTPRILSDVVEEESELRSEYSISSLGSVEQGRGLDVLFQFLPS